MKRHILATVMVAVTSLSLAACGSSEDDAPGTGTGGSEVQKDTSEPDLPAVKVGMIAPQGTAQGDLPDLPAAVFAGVNALNARGGLNGHHVDAIYCNDKDDPNESATCARKMVDEGVVAMLGMAGGSNGGPKATPILEDAGIPVIGAESADPVLWNSKDAYFIAQPAPFNYSALIAYAVNNDLLPMAVAAADNPAGQQFAGFLEASLKDLSGEGFADVVPVADTTSDYAPIAGALLESDAKSVLAITALPQITGVGRALDSQGSDMVILAGSPASAKQLSDAGPWTSKLVNVGAYPAFSAPAMERFVQEMEDAQAAGVEHTSLEEAGPYAPYGWVALQALEQVTKGLDDITAETVTAALNEAQGVDLGGVAPAWTPSDAGPEGFSRVSSPVSWFSGFEDGQFVSLVDAGVSPEDLNALNFEAQLPPGAE